MKELLKEWNKYLKEDKEIKDYADVPGMTAKLEEPKVVKFTYDAKPDKYAASRKWLEKAAKEFFSGVESDLEAGIVSREDYLEDLHGPSKVKVGYRMKNKDFDEAANLAEMEVYNTYDNFALYDMGEIGRELAFNKALLKYLDPRSQQYQDARYLVSHYDFTHQLPPTKETFRYRVPGQVEYRAGALQED